MSALAASGDHGRPPATLADAPSLVGGRTEPFVAAASVTGPAHARAGTEGEDRFAALTIPGGAVLVVADGLGSAPAAALGASVASGAAAVAGRYLLSGGASLPAVVWTMTSAARVVLEETAEDARRPIGDLACTLVAVAVRGRAACAGHIGDGGAVVVTPLGARTLSRPGPAEYVDETDTLTALDWFEHVRVSDVFDDVSAVLLFTDGCQRAVLRDGVAHPGFVDPVVAFTADAAAAARVDDAASGVSTELGRLLSGPKLAAHSDDDKTLVVCITRT